VIRLRTEALLSNARHAQGGCLVCLCEPTD
jgi:hypothetical protein